MSDAGEPNVSVTRDDLVGRWKDLTVGVTTIELRPDGTATVLAELPSGHTEQSSATWEWINPTHWKLRMEIPADPNIPGLEDGAVEVQEYEVGAYTGETMELRTFDFEFRMLWQRVEG